MLGQNGTYTVAVKGYTYDKHCNIIPTTYRFPHKNRLCAFSSSSSASTFSSSPFFFFSSSFLFSPLALILPHLNTDRQKRERGRGREKRDPKPCMPIRRKGGGMSNSKWKGEIFRSRMQWDETAWRYFGMSQDGRSQGHIWLPWALAEEGL